MKKCMRLLSVLCVVALLFCLVACGDNPSTPQNGNETTVGDTTLQTTAPVTDPPATQAPATQAPGTQAPGTQTPETQAPGTQVPETQPPVILPPNETEPPATQEPNEIKNIILIIGDGMGLEHINAGMLTSGKQYNFVNWQNTLVNTDSVNSSGIGDILTDSAAAGTALASGQLTVNGYVGKNHSGEDVVTILDRASALGKATGVVTTDTLFGATPGAFSAHNISRDDAEGLFASHLTSGVNLLCGATDPITSNIPLIAAAGYEYCDTLKETEDTFRYDKVYWQLPLASSRPEVRLCDASVKALDYLDQDEDGFVIMIEQAHIDKYSHNNQFADMAACADSLNDTVEAILAWIGDRTDTAVLITADHETGGLTVSKNDLGADSHTTAMGKTVYYKWTTTGHTRADVGLFVHGITADFKELSKYGSADRVKNTNVYDLMYDILSRPAHYGDLR